MRLTLARIWVAAILPAYAYMGERQVVKNKPFIADVDQKNAPLTPTEHCQLFPLDRQALDQRVRRSNNVPSPRLTDQDRSQLWHLHDTSKAAATSSKLRKPYTPQDREQLWHLDEQKQQSMRNDHPSSLLPRRMSSQDYVGLFLQQTAHVGETKLSDHAPYTALDRAQLWHLNAEYKQPSHKFRLLSSQDRAQLWHLNDNDTKIRGHQTVANNGETSYTDRDLQLLWHLDEQAKLLHDETKHQVYSDQDRAQLWHLNDETQRHHSTKKAGDDEPKEGSYTHQDRARLWHLEDYGKGHDDAGTKNAPYTPQDYQELWHL